MANKFWNDDFRFESSSLSKAERGENCRCNICNSVSSADISDDLGRWSPKEFYHDPDGSGFLCRECVDSIYYVQTEWDIEDDLDYEFDPDEEFYFDE